MSVFLGDFLLWNYELGSFWKLLDILACISKKSSNLVMIP